MRYVFSNVNCYGVRDPKTSLLVTCLVFSTNSFLRPIAMVIASMNGESLSGRLFFS